MKVLKGGSLSASDGKTYKFKRFQQGDKENCKFAEFTEHVWFDKAVMGGKEVHFILHCMNYEDDSYYGTPIWFAAQKKIEELKNADEFNASFFENDAIPKGIFWTKGATLDDEAETDVKELFEGKFKGAAGKHGLLQIEMDDESEIGYLKINDKIIDGSFLNSMRDGKTDVCASFGVPPKKVGLEVAGRLGGGNEFQEQMKSYYEDWITPLQEYFESKFSLLVQDGSVQLKRPPEIKVSAGNKSEGVQKNKTKSVIDTLIELRSNLIDAE